MGWLTGWTYRKSHVINGATGAGTNYQIRIKTHYGSGTDSGEDVYLNSHSRTDFGDVRFTDDDGTTLLDYWMEEYVDSDYAIFWIEVQDDLGTDQTIYIYYGKSDATTTSNGDNTFILFDDFSGDSLDTSKWSDVSDGSASAYVDTANHWLVLHQDGINRGYLRSANEISEKNILIRCKGKSETTDGQLLALLHWDGAHTASYDNPDNAYRAGRRHSALSDFAMYKFVSASNVWTETVSATIDTDFHILDFGHYNDHLILNWDDTNKITKDDTDTTEFSTLYIGLSSREKTSDTYVDWVFARKYVDPEPSHGSWGSEETEVAAGQPYISRVQQITGMQTYNPIH